MEGVNKRKAESPELTDWDARHVRPRLSTTIPIRPVYKLKDDPYNPRRPFPLLESHEIEFRRTHVKHSPPGDPTVRMAIQDFVRDDVIEEIHSILANPDAPLEDQEQLTALVAEEVLYKDVWGLSSSLATPEKLEYALEQVSRTAQYLFGYSRPAAANPDGAIRLFLKDPEGVRSMAVAQAKSVFERPFNLSAWQHLPLDLHDVRPNLAIDKKIAKVEKRLTKRYKAVAKKRVEEEWLKFWLHLTEGTKTVDELLRCEDERPRRVSLLLAWACLDGRYAAGSQGGELLPTQGSGGFVGAVDVQGDGAEASDA